MTKNGKAPGEERPVTREDCEITNQLNINVCSVLLGTPGLPAPVLCLFLSHYEAGFCASSVVKPCDLMGTYPEGETSVDTKLLTCVANQAWCPV